MLKIYGSPVSPPTNKVRFVSNALGLEHEFVRVNLAQGEHKTEDFLALNPVGKVPVIQDDDVVLFESNAITKYLAQKTGSSLYPTDMVQRAHVDKWIDYSSLHIGSCVNSLFFNRVLAPFFQVEPDQRALEENQGFLERFLPVVEGQLSNNSFLCGDNMTLADYNLFAILDVAEVSGLDLSPYPKLVAWRNGLQTKEFYTKCHENYAQALKAVTG